MTRINDEMLMAYADGELDAATAADVRRAIDDDPALRARLSMFERTRTASKDAFAAVLDEPVPAALTEAIRRAAPAPTMQRAPGRSWLRFLVPTAAVAAALVVGYVGGARLSSPVAPGAVPMADIATATAGLPTGGVANVAGASVTVAGTYATTDGYCRVLAVARGQDGWRVLACGAGGAWTVRVAVADASVGGASGYTPASGGVAETIDAYLDWEGAGSPLDAAAETAAIGGNWRATE